MVSCPDGLFVFHDMKDIVPAFRFPLFVFLLGHIGYHVGKAAFSASFAGYFFRMVHFQDIAQIHDRDKFGFILYDDKRLFPFKTDP